MTSGTRPLTLHAGAVPRWVGSHERVIAGRVRGESPFRVTRWSAVSPTMTAVAGPPTLRRPPVSPQLPSEDAP